MLATHAPCALPMPCHDNGQPFDSYSCGDDCYHVVGRYFLRRDTPAIAIAEVLAIIDAERASWGSLQDNEQAWAAVSRIRSAVESHGT